jgi:hypothetical protein
MVNSTPPGGDFGPSPQTQQLRPNSNLDDHQANEARRLRRDGRDIPDIAEEFGVAIEEIELALAPMRTPLHFHRRRTVNVGLEAYREILNERRPGEAIWQTIDRLLTDLHSFRQIYGGQPSQFR